MIERRRRTREPVLEAESRVGVAQHLGVEVARRQRREAQRLADDRHLHVETQRHLLAEQVADEVLASEQATRHRVLLRQDALQRMHLAHELARHARVQNIGRCLAGNLESHLFWSCLVACLLGVLVVGGVARGLASLVCVWRAKNE